MTPLTFLSIVTWLVVASVIYLKALAIIPNASKVRWFSMVLSLAWPLVLLIVAVRRLFGLDEEDSDA